MFDRISAATDGRRFRAWKLILLAALLAATLVLSGETSRAEPDVDVSVTDTEIILSWDVRGNVLFYWHPADGGKKKVETVSGKSHTISALQPDTKYRFFFFQGVYGELFVTTLADAPAPPAPATQDSQDTADATPCVPDLPSDAITVSEVTAWRDAHSHKSDHVLRWNRVLAALGDDVQATPLPLSESRANENKFMRSRWSRVSRTLDAIENCGVVQDPQATPELSIAAGPDVLEGETLSFTLTASPVPTTPLTVDIEIDTTGDFTVSNATRTITLHTSGVYDFRLASHDDGVDEPNGSVTATISAGSGFTVSSSAASATVTIQDDDDPPLPQVGISSAPHSVTEGENIELTVTSTPAPTSDLDVTLTVSTIGDFGASPGQQTVTIPTSGSATVTLSTTDDDVDEEDGFVTIEISVGSGYEPAIPTSIRVVTVQDDDLKRAKQVQTQDQQTQVTPTISLNQKGDCNGSNAASYDVDEDTKLSFTICASGANLPTEAKLRIITGKTPVDGQPIDGTHYIAGTTPLSNQTVTSEGTIVTGKYMTTQDITVTTNASSTSETLQYKLKRTLYDQPDTTITVTVLSGDGYNVGSQKLLTMTIKDNDDPPQGLGSCYGTRVSGKDFTSWQAAAYRAIPTQYKGDYVLWTRVILALGEAPENVDGSTGLVAITSKEIQDLGLMTRKPQDHQGPFLEIEMWTEAYNALTTLEECEAQKAPKQGPSQDQQDQQVQATPSISLSQNSDCSSNEDSTDSDTDVTTYDVDEDAKLSFTICAAGANLPSAVKLQIIRGKLPDPELDPDGTHYINAPNPLSGQTVANDSNLASGGYKLHQFITVTTTQSTAETLQYKLKHTLYDQPNTTIQVEVLSGDGYTVGSQNLLTITVQDNDETPTVFSSCFPDRVSGREFTSWQAAAYRATPTQYSTDYTPWSRVLLALGEPKASVPHSASLSPMTSAEIQTMGLMTRTTDLHNAPVAENGWWTKAYNTLKKLDECKAAQEATKQDPEPDPQPLSAPDAQTQATPSISLSQNSDCSSNDDSTDSDTDVTTYDVDEDSKLSFTICSTDANLPSSVKLRIITGKNLGAGHATDGTHRIATSQPSSKQKVTVGNLYVELPDMVSKDLTVTTNTSNMSEMLEYKPARSRYAQPSTTAQVIVLAGDDYTVGSQKRLTITITDNDPTPTDFSSCFPKRHSGRHFTSWQAEVYRNLATPFSGDNVLWRRVLLALGETKDDVPGSAALSPMTTADIETLNLRNRSKVFDSHFVAIENSMWTQAYNTLKKLEECKAPSTQNGQQSQVDQGIQATVATAQQDSQPEPTPTKRTYDSSKTLMENCETNLVTNTMFTLEVFTKQRSLYDYPHAEEAFQRIQAALGAASLAANIVPMTASELKFLRDQFTPEVGPYRHYHKVHQVEWAQMDTAHRTLVMLDECAANDFTTPVEPKVSITSHPNAHSGTGITFTVTAFPAPTETLTVPVSLVTDTDIEVPQPLVSVDSSGVGTVTVTIPDESSSVTGVLNAGTGYSLRDASTNSATVNIVADDVRLKGRTPTISITKVTVNGVADDDLQVTANTGDTVDIVVVADIGLSGIARIGNTTDFKGIGKVRTTFHRIDGTEITGQPVLGIALSPEGKGFKRRGLGIYGLAVEKKFIVRTVVDKTRPHGSDGTVTFNIEGGFGYLVDLDAREVVINVRPSSP